MTKSFKITASLFATTAFCAMLFTVSCKKFPVITPGPIHKDSLFVLTVAYCSKTTTSCDGSATANVSGGVQPYQYHWSNGQTTKTISGVCPGVYSVAINDASGKSTKGSATVNVCGVLLDSVPHVSITSTCSAKDTSVINPTGCNGTAIPIVHGGKLPYTYQWSNGQSKATATGLCPGTYTLTVKDALGKQATNTVTVQYCPVPAPHVEVLSSCSAKDTNIFNPTGCNGSATALMSWGASPHTFLWSNGKTTNSISGLCPGTYTVTVTDAKGIKTTGATTIKYCH